MSDATDRLIELLNNQHKEVMAAQGDWMNRLGELRGRMTDVEQAITANRGGGGRGGFGSAHGLSLGAIVAASDDVKKLAGGGKGSIKISIDLTKVQNAVTSVDGSAGSLIAPDRQREPILMPRQRPAVRALLQPGQTTSPLIEFTRQTGRTNNARTVSEGEEKPESNIVFELDETKVKTIATWIPVSRQAWDDAYQLQSVIDGELRYMVDFEEEQQILAGDGTGENLLGLIPQATPYNGEVLGGITAETNFDTILKAIAQAQQSKIMATGVVLNDLDWKRMQAIKDGEERYIGGGPFAAISSGVWQVPVIDTPALDPGDFLVGGFNPAAQIIDRMQMEVLASSEDRDNFIKNMITVRAEKRVALAVKIPEAIVHGEFPNAT